MAQVAEQGAKSATQDKPTSKPAVSQISPKARLGGQSVLPPATDQYFSVKVGFRGVPASGGGGHVIFVKQIIDENNMLAEVYVDCLQKKQLVWFKMPTTGITNGETYKTENQWFEATTTKKYETALGSNTVIVFEPIDRPKTEGEVEAEKRAAKAAENRIASGKRLAAKKIKQLSEDARVWKSANGKYSVVATFLFEGFRYSPTEEKGRCGRDRQARSAFRGRSEVARDGRRISRPHRSPIGNESSPPNIGGLVLSRVISQEETASRRLLPSLGIVACD